MTHAALLSVCVKRFIRHDVLICQPRGRGTQLSSWYECVARRPKVLRMDFHQILGFEELIFAQFEALGTEI